MKPHEIEFRALSAIEALQEGSTLPEASIAAFPAWPAPTAATARRLAAESNTARGRELLWLIGIEANGKIKGASTREFKAWWGKLQQHFESLSPELSPLAVPEPGGKKIVALSIQTVRAPFLIAKRTKTNFTAEVPWFQNGACRSARRAELISILSPLQDLPMFEILEAELSAWKPHQIAFGPKLTFRWSLDATIYVVPKGEARIVIPFHKCKSEIGLTGTSFRSPGTELTLTPDKASTSVRATESALLIEGLGRFFLFCCGQTAEPDLPLKKSAKIIFDFLPTGASRSASIETDCLPGGVKEANQVARWKL